MATTNMNLTLPTVSITVGPEWATLLNAALTDIDAHDHTSGKGVKITPAGLNINADLELNGNAITEAVRVVLAASGSGISRSRYSTAGQRPFD